jgi:uncharacterized protein YbjT (DUF2867 family)
LTQTEAAKAQSVMVIGATGNVGRQVVSQLLAAGAAVRALTGDPAAAGLAGDVDVVCADLSAVDTLDACVKGGEAVFLVWPFLTDDGAPAILDTLARHVRRIVYLSSLGVRDELERQADPINQFHAELEQLIEQTALEWTFLRSAGFASNALWWAPQIRTDGVVRGPYGAALRPSIHERDIAAVAVRALTGDGHAGAKHLLTGLQALTQVEQVRTIGEAIGRPLHYQEISREAARQQLLTALPPAVVDGILDAHARFVTQPEPVLPTVERLTGTPARTFREWPVDHADDFR